jgi:hypothetical protein
MAIEYKYDRETGIVYQSHVAVDGYSGEFMRLGINHAVFGEDGDARVLYDVELKLDVELEALDFCCCDCGDWHDLSDATAINRELYCGNCVTHCANCMEEIRTENATEINGEQYCDDCITYCTVCDDAILRVDAYRRHGEDYCEICYLERHTTCDCCEDEILRNDSIYVGSTDQTICPYCHDHRFFRCQGCYEVYPDHQDNGDNLCSDCSAARDTEEDDEAPARISHKRTIESYSYKPTPNHHGKGNQIGFELEIQCRDSRIDGELADAINYLGDGDLFYCKEDGSLRGTGFEVVSHPINQYWLDLGGRQHVDAMIQACRDSGAVSHDARDGVSCGLHFHLSRKSFASKSAIYRMAILIHSNLPFFEAFCRRTSNQWAKYHPHASTRGKAETCNKDHYSAVNLCNRHTVELRMFKGTLNPVTFWASWQLVNLLRDYCNHHTTLSRCALYPRQEIQRLIQYIIKHAKTCPELIVYLKKRQLMA